MSMTNQEDALLALGEVRGLLRAFAWFNTKINYGPTFTLERLAPDATLHDALHRYFDGDAREIQLTPIANWQSDLRSLLAKWLFAYRDSVLPSGVGAAGDSKSQTELVDHFVDLFQVALQPHAVWQVHIKFDSFYELVWNNVVFEGAAGAYFLHLGMSD